MNAVIRLDNVSKHYGDLCAVDGVSMSVAEGDILALVGASGCGKTSTLRLIAGLEQPDTGALWLGGKRVAAAEASDTEWVPPEDRRVGMVFQDYALFPHLSVADNVRFALTSRRGRKERVREMLKLVGLEHAENRFPHQLSGGQQQRVALARALAPNPAVVLLDEPFSNLDAALRQTMREDVRRILKEAGATAVFVTHDQEEALTVADKVAVMRRGALMQMGTPRDIYLEPTSKTVAGFIGEANWLPGTADGAFVECALGVLPLVRPIEGEVEVLLRPEAVQVTFAPRGNACVDSVRFHGPYQLLTLVLPDGVTITARVWSQVAVRVGSYVRVMVPGAVVAFPKDDDAAPKTEPVAEEVAAR